MAHDGFLVRRMSGRYTFDQPRLERNRPQVRTSAEKKTESFRVIAFIAVKIFAQHKLRVSSSL